MVTPPTVRNVLGRPHGHPPVPPPPAHASEVFYRAFGSALPPPAGRLSWDVLLDDALSLFATEEDNN